MSMNKPKLILGSSSPRRLELLKQVGIVPDIVTGAEIDETPLKDELPAPYCRRVALEKNAALSAQFPDDFILTADTTIALGRRILGKSETIEEAEKMLRLLSGRAHRAYTTIVLRMPNGKIATRLSETRLQVKRLSEGELRAFLAMNQWQGVAGSYNLQGAFMQYIVSLQGSPSGVVGLPLYETMQLLKGAGYGT